jgi:protein TonB
MVTFMNHRRRSSIHRQSGIGRSVGLAVVVALHLVLAYALVTGLGVIPMQKVPPTIDLSPVTAAPKTTEQRIETGDPKFRTEPSQPRDIQDPKVVFTFTLPPVREPQPQVSGGEAVHAPALPVLAAPRIDLAHSPKPAYPAISRRNEEHGKVTLAVLVGENGEVLDVQLEQSSGYPRLDKAAVEGVRDHYRFFPGTKDGHPERMLYRFAIVFDLRDAG